MTATVMMTSFPIDFLDKDFGREQYIDDCVAKVLEGQNVLVTVGGWFLLDNLPQPVRTKYAIWNHQQKDEIFFPGFEDAQEEIVKRINKLDKAVLIEESRNGAALNGYFISIL